MVDLRIHIPCTYEITVPNCIHIFILVCLYNSQFWDPNLFDKIFYITLNGIIPCSFNKYIGLK